MEDQPKPIRAPSLVDALIPLLFMVVMLTWSIVLFGIDAATGPLQVALLMSAVVGALVAHKNGHSWEKLGEEIVKGISLAMSAIRVLLMAGALSGVWNMTGTIGTVAYYGMTTILTPQVVGSNVYAPIRNMAKIRLPGLPALTSSVWNRMPNRPRGLDSSHHWSI